MSRRTLQVAPSPHQAPPVPTATRRDLFGSMGALLLLSAAEAGSAKAAELDGDLLAMCAEATNIDRESDRLWDACPADGSGDHPAWLAYNAHSNATLDHWHDLVNQIANTSAQTPEGLRAKAAFARNIAPPDNVHTSDPCDWIAMSLCRDILGRAGA